MIKTKFSDPLEQLAKKKEKENIIQDRSIGINNCTISSWNSF